MCEVGFSLIEFAFHFRARYNFVWPKSCLVIELSWGLGNQFCAVRMALRDGLRAEVEESIVRPTNWLEVGPDGIN